MFLKIFFLSILLAISYGRPQFAFPGKFSATHPSQSTLHKHFFLGIDSAAEGFRPNVINEGLLVECRWFEIERKWNLFSSIDFREFNSKAHSINEGISEVGLLPKLLKSFLSLFRNSWKLWVLRKRLRILRWKLRKWKLKLNIWLLSWRKFLLIEINKLKCLLNKYFSSFGIKNSNERGEYLTTNDTWREKRSKRKQNSQSVYLNPVCSSQFDICDTKNRCRASAMSIKVTMLRLSREKSILPASLAVKALAFSLSPWISIEKFLVLSFSARTIT